MKGEGLLRKAYKASGKIQAHFAPLVQMSPRTLSRVLNGKRALTKYEDARVRAYLKETRP